MTWIIPSDREGHWNPAGLSLKSPRFLSNRWGPPHSSLLQPILHVQPTDTPELTDVCRHHGRRQCAGMRGDKQIGRSYRAAGSLQFSPDATILAVSRDIERHHSHLAE